MKVTLETDPNEYYYVQFMGHQYYRSGDKNKYFISTDEFISAPLGIFDKNFKEIDIEKGIGPTEEENYLDGQVIDHFRKNCQ